MVLLFYQDTTMASSLALLALLSCLCAVCFHKVDAQPKYHSCAELYKSNVNRASATYTIYNRNNQPFQVYCEFHHGYGYTFISPATNVPININDLYTETDHVIVRDLRTDNKQYEARLEQLTKYKNIPISIQYNSHAGYSGIINAPMAPYVFIGLLPAAMQHIHKVEGYRINHEDIPFTNCDGTPNSYFAFLFNHNHAGITPYTPPDSPMIHQWVDKATPADPAYYLPKSYYSFFEVHQGGCGGYGIKPEFPHVQGAAVGIQYTIRCPAPQDIAHSTHHATGSEIGSTVTYTCIQGTYMLTGSQTLTCTETGIWSGAVPMCGQDACDSGPCQNGGTCIAETDDFLCECGPAFSGIHCQHAI